MILKINGINHFENIKEDNNSSIEHEGIDSHLKEDNLSNVNEYTNNISYINNACYYDNNNYTKFLGNLVQLNIKSENNDLSLKQKKINNKDCIKRNNKNIKFNLKDNKIKDDDNENIKKDIVCLIKSKERKCEYYQDKNIIKEKDKKYQIILHL